MDCICVKGRRDVVLRWEGEGGMGMGLELEG